jgi:hypothetical protein
LESVEVKNNFEEELVEIVQPAQPIESTIPIGESVEITDSVVSPVIPGVPEVPDVAQVDLIITPLIEPIIIYPLEGTEAEVVLIDS